MKFWTKKPLSNQLSRHLTVVKIPLLFLFAEILELKKSSEKVSGSWLFLIIENSKNVCMVRINVVETLYFPNFYLSGHFDLIYRNNPGYSTEKRFCLNAKNETGEKFRPTRRKIWPMRNTFDPRETYLTHKKKFRPRRKNYDPREKKIDPQEKILTREKNVFTH